jgi:hypothetical protein
MQVISLTGSLFVQAQMIFRNNVEKKQPRDIYCIIVADDYCGVNNRSRRGIYGNFSLSRYWHLG